MSEILQSEQQIALAGFEPAGNFTASWHTNVLNRQPCGINTENLSVCSQHKFLPYKLFQI
jgi:hypothetical protein